jgi:hypothetical protein
MRRATLDHPSRPILIHVPATSLEHLDTKAREAHLSRSEIIRQLLAPPVELGAPTRQEPTVGCQVRASGSTAVRCGSGRRE